LITLDTSAMIAAIDQTDAHHDEVIAVAEQETGPIVLPVPILAEITYLIERTIGARMVEDFLATVIQGDFALDCCEQDFPRALALVARYRDLPLGYADASVIACAERRGGKVLTLDRRHFGVVEREGTIQVLP